MSESGSNQSSGKPVSHTENPSSGKSPSSGSNMSAGFNSTIRQVAGGVPLPYDTSDTELSRETVLEILLNPDHSRLSQLPPVKPKGGNMFVFSCSNIDDWKCDQYLWVKDGMYPKIETETTEFKKEYYKIRLPGYVTKSGRRSPLTSTGFKRVGYWTPSNPSLVLIHYLGDENINKPIPHGNSNHENEHRRTMSSVLALARYIVENNFISLVPSQGVFVVQGRSNKYCVTIFPKETCQCPSTTTCHHILAAKMSIGLQPIEKKRVVNNMSCELKVRQN
jgi:hypothetical protein